MFGVLAIIGIGSFALHSTLHWLWQSSDEVPMLWQNLTFVFALFHLNTPRDQSTLLSAVTLLAIAAVQTYVYYAMQHLYWAFLTQYISLVTVIVFWTSYLVFYGSQNEQDESIRWYLYSRSMASYVLIASPLWIYEMHNCDSLIRSYESVYGLSFHVLWHMGKHISSVFMHTLADKYSNILWMFCYFN